MTELDEALQWVREQSDIHAVQLATVYRAAQAASAERIKALEHDLMWTDQAWEAAQEAVVYGYTLMDKQDERIKELEEVTRLKYRILNQHLIDAARLEGIRLGLEAAATAIDRECPEVPTEIIGDLDPETIAKEADQ
jgi:hypothetical protein